MSGYITPKNWREFQHYKDRNPPWIRLHKNLLDNYDWHRLPIASKALAPMLWLMASDVVDGKMDADVSKIAFRLRMREDDVIEALMPLIDKGFFELSDDATNLLAECKQVAVPETESLQRHSIPEAEAVDRSALLALLPPPAKPITAPEFLGDINIQDIKTTMVVKIATEWELPESWGIDAEKLGWVNGSILKEAEKFRQYWTVGKGAGKRRTLKGWRQSWGTWLARAERFSPQGV